MKKRLKYLLLISVMLTLCFTTKVEASYHASDRTVTSGGSVSITITSTTGLENFDISCTDDGGLDYKSCSSSVTGAAVNSKDGLISFASIGANAKTLATYRFTAPKVSSKKTYTVKFNVNGSTVSSKVTVNPKSNSNSTSSENNSSSSSSSNEKSSNANLSTLGVTPKEYDFSGFSSSKTSYSVTIPNDVDRLNVAYKTANSKAKVKVTGNTDLEVGTNTIKVVVTAEDGKTTKTYTIKVTKLATEDEKPGNVIDDENNNSLYLTSLSLEGLVLTPEFASDIYSYTTTIDMDSNDMSKVKVNAVANNEDATVEITGNTNLVEGENLINIIVKAGNSTEQTVYQVTVNKISQASEVVSGNLIDQLKNIKKEYLIIGGFILIVVIILIIIIVKAIRNRKYADEYDDEEEYADNNLYNYKNDNDDDNFNNFNNTVSEEAETENIVEELFKKRRNGEELNKEEKETVEDIEQETDRIFNKPKQGSTVEYNETEMEKEEQEETRDNTEKSEPEEPSEDYIEERKNKRKKGRHF